MKRCLSASSSSCSSPSSSSASSSLEFQNHDQTKPSRGRGSNKRARRSVNGNGDGKNEDDKSKKKRKMRGISSSSPAINGGRRSSVYRGVTRHRWTGRFEAHLWDKSCWNNVQNKKGRQVYLGAYDNEEAAARTYDLAALKYWGKDSTLNFPIEMYAKELEEMEKVTKEEYLASLRRQSSGFSRGVSKYRGVARHHHNGRWEARIGRVLGNKYLYLGTYSTQEEAATAYDLAAIQYRGANAVTNFDISRYIDKINLINQNNNNDISQQNQTLSTTPSQIEDAKTTNKISPPNEECSPIIAQVDPTNEHDELPWIFMDDDRFSQFQVPDLPDSDILSVFGDGGHGGRRFDDDIGFLFRPDPEEADFNLDSILSSLSYGDDEYVQEKLMCCANSASCSPNSSISYLDYR